MASYCPLKSSQFNGFVNISAFYPAAAKQRIQTRCWSICACIKAWLKSISLHRFFQCCLRVMTNAGWLSDLIYGTIGHWVGSSTHTFDVGGMFNGLIKLNICAFSCFHGQSMFLFRLPHEKSVITCDSKAEFWVAIAFQAAEAGIIKYSQHSESGWGRLSWWETDTSVHLIVNVSYGGFHYVPLMTGRILHGLTKDFCDKGKVGRVISAIYRISPTNFL